MSRHLFAKILVGLDGSPYSDKALIYALEIAKRFSSKITVMYIVVRPLHLYGDEGVVLAEPSDKRLEEEGEKILKKAKEQASNEGVEIDSLMTSGDPSEELLKASRQDYDLVVLGSRGLSRVKAFLLGSVSSRVSHYAKCPVLIVKPWPAEE
ncbi:MAG: universal stress protein [Thaumarchaeota archaeon]|nr:universal stress protein [Nitrososphaerota archaeon]